MKRKEKKGRRWAEEKPDGVVHVRAKRGQATDRHSQAERVKRLSLSFSLTLTYTHIFDRELH